MISAGDLEHKIIEILGSDENIPVDKVKEKDYAGQSGKSRWHKEQDPMKKKEILMLALENSLTAAKGYKILGKHNLKQANSLVRTAEYIDLLLKNDKCSKDKYIAGVYNLYALLNTEAGLLFIKEGDVKKAGDAFLHAAYGYAKAGNFSETDNFLKRHFYLSHNPTKKQKQLEKETKRIRYENVIDKAMQADSFFAGL